MLNTNEQLRANHRRLNNGKYINIEPWSENEHSVTFKVYYTSQEVGTGKFERHKWFVKVARQNHVQTIQREGLLLKDLMSALKPGCERYFLLPFRRTDVYRKRLSSHWPRIEGDIATSVAYLASRRKRYADLGTSPTNIRKRMLFLEYESGLKTVKSLDKKAKDQLHEAVMCMFRAGIVHTNLHPGNVLIGDSKVPRIIDFSRAVRVGKYRGENVRAWYEGSTRNRVVEASNLRWVKNGAAGNGKGYSRNAAARPANGSTRSNGSNSSDGGPRSFRFFWS